MGRRLLMLAGLCGLAFFSLAAAALAAPKWLSPVDLSAPLRDASNADVVMDDAGDVVAVWERVAAPSHPVQGSVREAGGDYGGVVELSPSGTAPDVAITPSGTSIVVFGHFDAVSGRELIQARIRPPGGNFEPTVTIATLEPGGFSVSPRVAVNEGGDAAVVWLNQVEPEPGKKKNVVEVSTMAAAGSFSTPVELSDPSHNAFEPEVVVDPSGNALVVWEEFVSEEEPSVILFSSGDGAIFTPATPISTADFAFEPELALDSAGDPTVVWRGVEEIEPAVFEPAVIEATSRAGEGSFTTPVSLSDPAHAASEPQLAIAPSGETTVVWVRFVLTDSVVQGAIRPAGGSFAAAGDLSKEGEGAQRPDLAVNAAGTTTVAWQAGSPTIIQASIRSPGGAFGPPAELSAPGEPALFPKVAMDQAGDGVALWLRSNGSDNIAQAAGYDANSPQFRSVTIPSQGTVGDPVAFSADPFDVWSIASTVFDFGDGTSQAGASVSHTYSAPGTYPVTGTAVDNAGNPVTAGGTIAISPVYAFRIGKHKRNKKRGTVQLTVVVPGPGDVVASGKGVKRQHRRAASAGSVKVMIAGKGKTLRRLKEKGKARVRTTISFSPDGGDHSARQRIVIVLIKKH